jgi:hypothetical protein
MTNWTVIFKTTRHIMLAVKSNAHKAVAFTYLFVTCTLYAPTDDADAAGINSIKIAVNNNAALIFSVVQSPPTYISSQFKFNKFSHIIY